MTDQSQSWKTGSADPPRPANSILVFAIFAFYKCILKLPAQWVMLFNASNARNLHQRSRCDKCIIYGWSS